MAERKRWAEEAQALKHVEEFKHSNCIRELKSELSESFQMIAYAKSGGAFDLQEAHKAMEDYRQQAAATASSSSSSAAVAPPLHDQQVEQETTVRAAAPASDLGDEGKDKFVFVTGEE